MDKLSILNWQGIPIQIKDRDAYPRQVKVLIVGPEILNYRADPDLPTYIEQAISDLGGECITLAEPYMGWTTPGLSFEPYKTFIENWAAANTDEALEITDLVIMNGLRDYIMNIAILEDTINQTLSDVVPLFPNARIHTSWLGWGAFTDADFANVVTAYEIQKERTIALGYNWIPLEALCHACASPTPPTDGDFQGITDMNLTLKGGQRFAAALANYLIKGLLPERSDTLYSELEGFVGTENHAYFYSYVDVRQMISHMYTNDTMHFEYSTPTTFTGDGSQKQIAYGTQFKDDYVFGHLNMNGKEWSGTVIITLKTSGGSYTMPARIYIYLGDVYLSIVDETGGTPATWSVTDLYISPFELTCDTMKN